MAARSTLRTWLYYWLNTASDDPAFPADLLNATLQQSYDGLVQDLQDANPGYLVAEVTLAASSATSHSYYFASQSVPVTDFAKWLQVRYDNQDGAELDECRYDELTEAGPGYFAIRGIDSAPVLQTSPDTEAGKSLWFQYSSWPAEMAADGDTPAVIPSRFHDVVALDCLFLFGIGGEQRVPPELRERWQIRRSQLLSRSGRRGVATSRTRLVEPIVL